MSGPCSATSFRDSAVRVTVVPLGSYMSALPETSPSSAYFDQMENDHQRLCTEVEFALRDAVDRAGIKTHSISARVKDKASYLDKIARKGYENPLQEVEDIVGIRVVCLFMGDLPDSKNLCTMSSLF